MGHQELSIEEYYSYFDDSSEGRDQAKAQLEKDNQANIDAWHPPEEFINTLEAFLDALQDNPKIYEQLDIEESYFLNDNFVHDLNDLLTAARWAADQGETTMRLVMI